MSKTLVAYFSCTGLTEKLARKIADVVDGDLYRIEPAVPYTEADLDWNNPKSRSTVEMNDMSTRPEVTGKVQNMDQYDTVFVGFPIWWYVAPTIINTFLESYNFSKKTVIPFATSGSSGVGETEKYLKTSCAKGTKWVPAKRFPNSVTKEALEKWVKESL